MGRKFGSKFAAANAEQKSYPITQLAVAKKVESVLVLQKKRENIHMHPR